MAGASQISAYGKETMGAQQCSQQWTKLPMKFGLKTPACSRHSWIQPFIVPAQSLMYFILSDWQKYIQIQCPEATGHASQCIQSGHKSHSQAAKNPHTFPIVGLWFADLLGKEVLTSERHTGCSSNTVRPGQGCDNILVYLA